MMEGKRNVGEERGKLVSNPCKGSAHMGEGGIKGGEELFFFAIHPIQASMLSKAAQ
jgi:hypothetical protein